MNPKIFLLALALAAMSLQAAVVNYIPDNTTIFSNPERGFIHQCSRHKGASYHAVKGHEWTIGNHMTKDNVSLILVLYYLDEFNNTAILPDAVFEAFDEDMEILRQKGLKAILRFAYAESDNGKSGSERSAEDAPLAIIQSHLAQYKPYWEKNADVIYCFQAGFVGQYGEWYYTDNFGNHVPHINDDCRALIDTALKAIPQNRTLLLRRPMFKQEYLDGVALTDKEAYTGTPKSRLGHFNDAFLYSLDNMGTYSTNAQDRAAQKALIAQETLYVPIGGETNITKDSLANIWATLDATVAEMSTLHWTFIKNSYAEAVTNMWRENGTFDTLNVHMGYRYNLLSATLPETAIAGASVNIELNIKNVGYAPLYNERHAYIVLKNGKTTYSIQLTSDPRTWLPNGVTTTINEQLTIPADIVNGTYQLYLHLPDAYESIASDPRYAVRFGNADMWEPTSGMNNLKASVVVTGGLEPEPEPEPVYPLFTDSLNKANASNYIEGMTWYGDNDEYFDFESNIEHNTNRWVEWDVKFETPGKYTITEMTYSSTGHCYNLQLLDGDKLVAEYTSANIWTLGDLNLLLDEKWDLCNVEIGIYTLRVKNVMEYGAPKLKSLKIDLFGAVSMDTVTLPGTFNKANVADFSDKIGWYNEDYFDLGVKDADNTDHWLKWRVNLKYPGKYIVSEVSYSSNSHSYTLQLLDGETVISQYTTKKLSGTPEVQNVTHDEMWDLSTVPSGQYILRVNNATNWGRPKLQSLALEYESEIPTSIENDQMPIDKSSNRKFIQSGQLLIERDGQLFNVLGTRVR